MPPSWRRRGGLRLRFPDGDETRICRAYPAFLRTRIIPPRTPAARGPPPVGGGAPGRTSAVDEGEAGRVVAAAGDLLGRRGGLDRGEVLGGQLDGQCPQVLLQVPLPRVPGIGTTSSPRTAQARASWPAVTDLAAASSSSCATIARFRSRFPSANRGWPRHVGLRHPVERGVTAGQGSRGRAARTAPRRCRSSRQTGTISASRSRVHNDHSLCGAEIGCTACARRMSLRAGLGQPEVTDLAGPAPVPAHGAADSPSFRAPGGSNPVLV